MRIKLFSSLLLIVLLSVSFLIPVMAETESIGNVTIYRGTPTVDGVIAENEYLTVITLDKINMKAFDQFEQNTVPDGFSLKLYLSWNDSGLFVGYSVTDTTPVTAESGWKFNGDLIQLFADLGPTISGQHTTDESAIGRRAPLFTTGLDADGVLYYLHQCVPSEEILNFVSDGGYQYEGKSTENGWNAEYMIPWKMLIDDINTKVEDASLSLSDVKAGTVINMMAIYNDFNRDRELIGWYASTNTTDSDPFDWQPEIFGIYGVLDVKEETSPETYDLISGVIAAAGCCFSVLMISKVKKKSAAK